MGYPETTSLTGLLKVSPVQCLPDLLGGVSGSFEVELGFLHGTLWLFQVRPFV